MYEQPSQVKTGLTVFEIWCQRASILKSANTRVKKPVTRITLLRLQYQKKAMGKKFQDIPYCAS